MTLNDAAATASSEIYAEQKDWNLTNMALQNFMSTVPLFVMPGFQIESKISTGRHSLSDLSVSYYAVGASVVI